MPLAPPTKDEIERQLTNLPQGCTSSSCAMPRRLALSGGERGAA